MRTHHSSNFIFLILLNPNPINLLKCILRFVLNFNIASSLNRKLMSITTVVITLARLASGASSLKSSTNLLAFIVFNLLFNLNFILSGIFFIDKVMLISSTTSILSIYSLDSSSKPHFLEAFVVFKELFNFIIILNVIVDLLYSGSWKLERYKRVCQG